MISKERLIAPKCSEELCAIPRWRLEVDEHDKREATESEHVTSAHHVGGLKYLVLGVLQEQPQLPSGRFTLIDNQHTARTPKRLRATRRWDEESSIAAGCSDLPMAHAALQL